MQRTPQPLPSQFHSEVSMLQYQLPQNWLFWDTFTLSTVCRAKTPVMKHRGTAVTLCMFNTTPVYFQHPILPWGLFYNSFHSWQITLFNYQSVLISLAEICFCYLLGILMSDARPFPKPATGSMPFLGELLIDAFFTFSWSEIKGEKVYFVWLSLCFCIILFYIGMSSCLKKKSLMKLLFLPSYFSTSLLLKNLLFLHLILNLLTKLSWSWLSWGGLFQERHPNIISLAERKACRSQLSLRAAARQ